MFTLETHVCYLREVGVGETVEVEARVLDLDAKRLHLFQILRRAGEADPAATAETAWLNVDMTPGAGRRSGPRSTRSSRRSGRSGRPSPGPSRAGRAGAASRRPPA